MFKSTILAAVAFCLAGAPCMIFAQDGQRPAQPAGPAPKIVFETEELDIGSMSDTDKGEGTFILRNAGDATLIITGLGSSCGCTEPRIGGVVVSGGKTPAPVRVEIAPGESTTIEVNYNPLGKQDKDVQKVTIECNDPARPRIELQLIAHVEPLVRVDPRVLNLGDIDRGKSSTFTFKVSGSTPDFRVTRVTVNGIDSVRARILGSKEIQRLGGKSNEFEIELASDGSARPGQLRGTALVRTNDPRRPFTSIEIMGRIVGDLALSESRVAFGNLKVGHSSEKTFRIHSKMGQPFEILALDQPGEDNHRLQLSYKPVDDKKTAYDITAHLTAPMQPGGVRGTIIVRTNYPDEENVSMPFFAIVTE